MPKMIHELPIKKGLLDHHLERFNENRIPIYSSLPEGGEMNLRIAVIAPAHARLSPKVARMISVAAAAGDSILFIKQRAQGKPYASDARPPVYTINLWPQGSFVPASEKRLRGPLKRPRLLRWASAMAEDAVAASELFDANLVIGVDAAGGTIAAEIAERRRIPMLLFLTRIYGEVSEQAAFRTRAKVLATLTELWAEESAALAANLIVMSKSLYAAHSDRFARIDKRAIAFDPRNFRRSIEELMSSPGKLTGKAYHRATQTWRGDVLKIKWGHIKAARELASLLPKWTARTHSEGRRLIVSFGGESGSGKTEIASVLSLIMHARGINTALIPGDAFFRKPPPENHEIRLRLFREGVNKLRRYLMSANEIDYARLDSVLGTAARMRRDTVHIPSDARRIDVFEDASGKLVRAFRRYEDAPVDLRDMHAAFVDLTTSARLKNPDVKAMNAHTYREKLKDIRKRNRARDPSQDFKFIVKVLALEHEKVAPLLAEANIIFDLDYNMELVKEPF